MSTLSSLIEAFETFQGGTHNTHVRKFFTALKSGALEFQGGEGKEEETLAIVQDMFRKQPLLAAKGDLLPKITQHISNLDLLFQVRMATFRPKPRDLKPPQVKLVTPDNIVDIVWGNYAELLSELLEIHAQRVCMILVLVNATMEYRVQWCYTFCQQMLELVGGHFDVSNWDTVNLRELWAQIEQDEDACEVVWQYVFMLRLCQFGTVIPVLHVMSPKVDARTIQILEFFWHRGLDLLDQPHPPSKIEELFGDRAREFVLKFQRELRAKMASVPRDGGEVEILEISGGMMKRRTLPKTSVRNNRPDFDLQNPPADWTYKKPSISDDFHSLAFDIGSLFSKIWPKRKPGQTEIPPQTVQKTPRQPTVRPGSNAQDVVSPQTVQKTAQQPPARYPRGNRQIDFSQVKTRSRRKKSCMKMKTLGVVIPLLTTGVKYGIGIGTGIHAYLQGSPTDVSNNAEVIKNLLKCLKSGNQTCASILQDYEKDTYKYLWDMTFPESEVNVTELESELQTWNVNISGDVVPAGVFTYMHNIQSLQNPNAATLEYVRQLRDEKDTLASVAAQRLVYQVDKMKTFENPLQNIQTFITYNINKYNKTHTILEDAPFVCTHSQEPKVIDALQAYTILNPQLGPRSVLRLDDTTLCQLRTESDAINKNKFEVAVGIGMAKIEELEQKYGECQSTGQSTDCTQQLLGTIVQADSQVNATEQDIKEAFQEVQAETHKRQQVEAQLHKETSTLRTILTKTFHEWKTYFERLF